MKILSSNKGFSLIILVIAMTLVAILGTSFVSLVGMKQRGFLHQNDSYRALNIANAGMEYAIRYISDSVQDDWTDFFSNPSGISSVSFAGGNFVTTYNYSNDLLTINSTYRNSLRRIRLSNVRRYVEPLTLVFDPSSSSRKPNVYNWFSTYTVIDIPIMNNSNQTITINKIDIVMPLSGKYLRYIGFFTMTYGSYSNVYSYENDYKPYGNFDICGSPNCWNDSRGIWLKSNATASFSFGSNQPINAGSQRRCMLWFEVSGFSPGVQYELKFYYSLGTEARTATLRFRP